MVLVYGVCKCSYTLNKRTKKRIKEYLDRNGDSMGLHEIDHPIYEYARNSNCNVCDSPLLFTTKYSESQLLRHIKAKVGRELHESYPNKPKYR